MKTRTQKTVVAAMLAALVCVATMLIKIPSPLKGYLNLGDCVVLLAGWMLSPAYGFAAAGVGSALADIFSGYAFYAPATLIIKGVMAAVAFYGARIFKNSLAGRVISGVAAEVFMVLGYLIFEGFMYGFAAAVVNIAPNAVQGVAGLILGIALAKIFEKAKISL